MKKAFSILTIIVCIFCLSFVGAKEAIEKNQATVNQISGLYVFLESRPAAAYEVLGTVKKQGVVWNGKSREMMDIMIRRTHKQFPTAEGIIFDDLGMASVTVIKFK